MANFDLKTWMQESGWNQTRLATRLELSRWTIRRYMDKGAPAYIELACRALETDK